MVSSDFHCKENYGTNGAAHFIQTLLAISSDIRRVRSLVFCQESLNHVHCCSCSVIFLTMKVWREHYTLPHSNAACHQLMLSTGGKNSCISMKVQSCLIQVCFIEIHQVFAKKKYGRIFFLTEWYIPIYTPLYEKYLYLSLLIDFAMIFKIFTAQYYSYSLLYMESCCVQQCFKQH